MIKRTEAIVLKNFPLGEADLIVTYLTHDYGVLRVFAKSPRKTKSRFGSSLEPLTYSRIAFIGREDANLPRLTQSDIIRPFHALREDIDSFINVSGILKLSLKLLPERDVNPDVFNLLLEVIKGLESDRGNRLYYLYYKIKFLEIMGYAPRLDVCGRCGEVARGNRHHNFYLSSGSLLCETCIGNSDKFVMISEGSRRFYGSLSKWKQPLLSRVKVHEHLLIEVSNFVDSHIQGVIAHIP